MQKEKIIRGLEMILEGLKEEVSKESVAEVVEVAPTVETTEGFAEFNEDELREMKYADLKKFASSIGVSAKGKRDEIIANILNREVKVTVEETEQEVPDNIVEFPKDKVVEEVDYLEMAKEATEDMSLEEIREVLEENDIDSDGKKKDLIQKIAKAMEDGIIEIEEDDEEYEDEDEDVDDIDEEEDDFDDEDEDDEDFDDDDEEVDENTYFDVFDDGANDPDSVTSEERMKAMIRLQKEIIDDYESEALTDDDIEKFLKDNLTEEEFGEYIEDEDADEMDKFAIYCEFMKRLINDEGERVPMGEPYEITIDDEVSDYCCGHELEETDEGYVCEICGNVYESE